MNNDEITKIMREKANERNEKLAKEITENIVYINCPHCSETIEFKRGKSGRIFGTIAGGTIGTGLAFKLGIAGAIAGASVAIPATLVGTGLFALLGNKFGKDIDNSNTKCPKCEKKIVL